MQDFRKFQIWQKGMDLVIEVYKISKQLPGEEKFGLCSQITRSAVSIPSNIAEGSSSHSAKDFKRFLEFSLGSAFELETELLLIQTLKMADIKLVQGVLLTLEEEQKMINSFMQKLEKDKK